MANYDFAQLCRELGKAPVFVHHLQKSLDLHVARDGETYSESYLSFMEAVVALRTFTVPLDLIVETFGKERKILQLLHFDTINPSPTWYLDACGRYPYSNQTLLLTGHHVGFPLGRGAIQKNLNFQSTAAELFKGDEMGEDVSRVVSQYLKLEQKIREKVMMETPVLRNALAWSIPMISTRLTAKD